MYLPLVLIMVLGIPGSDGSATPKRLSPEAAAERIAAYIRSQKPEVKLGRDFAVVDLTTDDVWDRLGVQVVKVKDGPVEAHETFVLNAKRVLRIGSGFGGEGVTTIVTANLAEDDRPLLVFAFAWGSGLHRSEVGLLDPHDKEPKEILLKPANFSMEDYQVRLGAKRLVEVWAGKTQIGTIVASREGDTLSAKLELRSSLPDEVRKHLR